MASYDEDIAAAKDLIAEAGELSVIRRLTPGTVNPATPWVPVPPVPVNISVSAVWLNFTAGEVYVGGGLVKSTDKKVLIPAADVQDITPSDQLVRADGSVWKVAAAKLLDPNGQGILWTLQVGQ